MDERVIDLEKMQPHLVLQDPLTGNVNVLPVALVRRWVREDLEIPPDCARAIFSDWLSNLDASV